MSELRSVLDQMAATDTQMLGAEDLAGLIVEALHGQQQLEVLVARWTATLSEREGHQHLGYRSPTTFLMHRGRLSAGHANQVVARGNAAQRAPGAHTAWADGRLSTDQATSMFEVAEAVPDQYPDAEPRLVEIVEGLSVKDTRKAVEYWRQSVDGPGDLNGEAQQVRRRVSLSKTIGGMHYLSGWMTSLAGETLRTGLEALMPPPAETDTRTPRQRRHDALEELARQWLETGDTPYMG
ncbi:MAG: DUF222 domain-containing protein, partial [Acidimicrobiia bacterium]